MEGLADVSQTPLVDARRGPAVAPYDRFLGTLAQLVEPMGEGSAAAQVQGLAVRGPAGEEKPGRVAVAPKTLSDLFCPLQQADGCRAVHRAHPDDRDQLGESPEFQLEKRRLARQLHR
ncbi:hypothetical protein ACFWD7_56360 [Streptomyces mirabilis]|uniref:hypothetical protein n=1 Tax=Streptomyces mirabilis TaxID=68239 RepID=UPI0036BD626E